MRRDARSRLFVGLGVLHLASAVQPLLRDLAMPVLRSLAESLGSTAHLTVADGDEALALAVVEPTWTDFHVSYRVGARHALTQGAAGKAIALLDVDEPAYAVTSGELQTGARGLAAPVRGVDGLRASVGIVTLDGAIDEDVVAPQVIAAAARGRRAAQVTAARASGTTRCGIWVASAITVVDRSMPGSVSTWSITRWRSALERATTRAHMSPTPVIV